MKNAVRRFLYRRETDLALIGLILLSVGALVMEIATEAPGPRRIYDLAGTVTQVIFWVELAARWWVASSTGRFLGEYWLDVISVLPVPSADSLRLLRSVRLLRALRLLRAGFLLERRFSRFTGTPARGSGEIIIVLAAIAMIVLIGAAGIYQLEHRAGGSISSFGDAFWFSVFTMIAFQPTEVGSYSAGGRFVILLIALGGMTVFVGFVGVMAAVITERVFRRVEASPMDIDSLNGHVVVCGWRRSGRLILDDLRPEAGVQRPVVIIAETEAPLSDLANNRQEPPLYIKGDPTRIDVLRRAGIERASMAILLADDTQGRSDQDRDARTILAALVVERLNPKIVTCVELLNSENEGHLRMAGVENVVVPSEWGAHVMAYVAADQGFGHVLTELLAPNIGNSFFLADCPAWGVGLTFIELARRLKWEHDTILVGLEDPPPTTAPPAVGHPPAGRIRLNPAADATVRAGARLVVIAEKNLPSKKA